MEEAQNQEFNGKVCVITGGAGSIGLSSALRMYKAGGRIMLVDLSSKDLEIAKSKFKDHGRVATCSADVSDSRQTIFPRLFQNGVISMCYLPTLDLAERQHRLQIIQMKFLIKLWLSMSKALSWLVNTPYPK
jgi:NAD(P)-dependent dehydrogenase (short-subunit alcohol dehydrogenase family)